MSIPCHLWAVFMLGDAFESLIANLALELQRRGLFLFITQPCMLLEGLFHDKASATIVATEVGFNLTARFMFFMYFVADKTSTTIRAP